MRPLRLPKVREADSPEGAAEEALRAAIKGQRLAYSPVAKDFIPYTVYNRDRLLRGARFSGPAIVEERESTTIVGEDAYVSVENYGFLSITFKETK